jgi:hypothetical protein
MAFSLYDAVVPPYLQTLGGVSRILDLGLSHFQDTGVDPDAIVPATLLGDVQPFSFQITSILHHSIGAIGAAKAGLFGPPVDQPTLSYAALCGRVKDAAAAFAKLDPAEINALEGGEVLLRVGDVKKAFVTEDFLTSFSRPNFYFHAVTAYEILRSRGAPLKKLEYLGEVRFKD